jgi:2-succinyl-5-enolpyruvyl-6-hydroxy-3-cyclohexene-1-carboxylate synthase
VHVNLPMREPLLDVAAERARLEAGSATPAATPRPIRVHAASGLPSASAVTEIGTALAAARRGVVVAGPNAAQDATSAAAIARLAARLGWPILADPLSGLRFGDHDRSHVVDAYDVLLQGGALGADVHPDAVVQLGTPTVSASTQRLLAAARAPLHVVVASPGVWPDPLQRATDVVRADAGAFAAAVADVIDDAHARRDDGRATEREWLARWKRPAMRARRALDRALAGEPTLFEGTVLADLVARLSDGTSLHVGNSLPVRALDTFVGGAPGALQVACNRGANGIDGVVATALGATAAGRLPTVLVVGDLSFLHDVGALQIAARHRLPLLVLVVNNDGGGIFSFLPQAALADTFETLFGTPHGLAFAGAVEMCGGRYVRAARRADVVAAIDAWRDAPAFTVVEIPSDRAATRALHARLVAAACAAATADGDAAAKRVAEAR